MSELHDNIAAIVADRAPHTSGTVTNLVTGKTFTAEIEGNLDPFTLPDDLAKDPRSKFNLYVNDPIAAAGLLIGQNIQFRIFGQTTVAKLVMRSNDPASPQTKFTAVHVLTKDQQ